MQDYSGLRVYFDYHRCSDAYHHHLEHDALAIPDAVRIIRSLRALDHRLRLLIHDAICENVKTMETDVPRWICAYEKSWASTCTLNVQEGLDEAGDTRLINKICDLLHMSRLVACPKYDEERSGTSDDRNSTGLEYRTWYHSKQYNRFFNRFLCSSRSLLLHAKMAFYCDRIQSLFSILPESSIENVTFICDFIVLGTVIIFLPPLCCLNFLYITFSFCASINQRIIIKQIAEHIPKHSKSSWGR